MGLRRADCRFDRSPSDGVIETLSTPNVLRTTLPTSDEIGLASRRVARAISSSSSVRSRSRSAFSSASRVSRRSPNSIARMSTVDSGGSEEKSQAKRSRVPEARNVTR